MSKKKMTPAEVAETIGRFIAKQEETLKSYPVGPLGNSAKRNLKKGKEALAALQDKNEEMRMAMQPQGQAASPQMAAGGETVPASKSGFEVGLRQYNPGALESGKGELGKLADERFATFATLEDGWNALIRQLTRYQKGLTPGTSGDMTLSEAMGKYAPKYENDTAGYITTITSGTGANPNTPIKDIDINKWATAVSRVESPQAFVALENAGLLDSEAASVYANDALVRQARQSGVAEKFTTSFPQIGANRDTTGYSDIFNSPLTRDVATSDFPTEQASSLATMSAAPDMEAEAQRRAALTDQADVLDTMNFMNAQLGNVPNEAVMTGPNNTGYLGGTYGRDATNVAMNTVTPQQASDAAASQVAAERFAARPKEERSAINVGATMAGLSPNFSYDEVRDWAEENYGVSEGRANSRNESGIDNNIIGANLYQADDSYVFYSEEALERLGGAGVSVDETRVLLQSLVNSGLNKDQAFEALSDSKTYKAMKQSLDSPGFSDGRFGRRSQEMLAKSAINADKWSRNTKNREMLAGVVDRGEEGTDSYFPTELALGVTSDQTMQEGLREYDEQVFDARMERYRELIKQMPAGKTKLQAIAWAARPYTPGAGRTAFSGNETLDRQVSMLTNQAEDPVGTRQMPDFMKRTAGTAMNVAPIEQAYPEQILQNPVGVVPGEGEASGTKDGVAPLPVKNSEEVAAVLPTREIQTPGSPEMLEVNMPKINALQAVPAMASAASAAIQRRALNAMQGPQRPMETAIPQFAYESNIQSTLDDIRNATNTAGRNTNLPGQTAAANQQALMANRFRAEGRARAIDNQAKQAEKARYDAMAFQGRGVQNNLRSQYQNDMVQFNNQKAMLDAQIKQQPLNVLASSTQDYLKNIYAPNLAAMFESQGRQYGTNYTEENT